MSCGSIIGNIVVNCGFETGSFPPWTNSMFATIGIGSAIHTGNFGAVLSGDLGGPTSISQTLNTQPAGVYNLTFWLRQSIAVEPLSTLTILWGVQIVDIISNIPTVYTMYSYNVVAINNNTTLTFNSVRASNFNAIDDISVVLTGFVCFSGKSKIYSKNIITNEITNVNASEIFSNIHQVYSINDQKFIPIKYNIVNGPTIRYMLIKRDALGENQPSEDLYITSGHKIMINGKEIKAGKIPQAKRVKVNPENVYSIVTEKRLPILINNLHVMTYGYDEWLEYSGKKNIAWYDNK